MINDILFLIGLQSPILYRNLQLASKSFYRYIKSISTQRREEIRQSFYRKNTGSIEVYLPFGSLVKQEVKKIVRIHSSSWTELPNGKMDGQCEMFHRNGIRASVHFYRDGNLHGFFTYWNSDGTLRVQGNYLDGELDGSWIINYAFHQNIINFRRGIKHGQESYVSPKRRLEIDWENGIRQGSWLAYDFNGNLIERRNYQKGKLHGLSEGWYFDGNIKYRQLYQDGKLIGQSEEWYKNGNLKSRQPYQDGKLQGQVEEWYENGKLESRREYQNGELHGQSEKYYENGDPRLRYNYNKGELHGLYQKWKIDGNLRKQGNYQNGVREGLWSIYY